MPKGGEVRRSVGLLASTCVAACALVSGTLAYAAPMEPVNDDWNDLTATFAIVGQDGFSNGPPMVGQAFIDQNVLFGSTLQASTGSMGGPSANLGRCEEIDVAPCDKANSVYVNTVLPLCDATRTRDCVESLYVRKDGVVTDGAPAGEWDSSDSYTFKAIETDKGLTPASGKLPLFTLDVAHSGGSLYAASVQVDLGLTRRANGWSATSSSLSAQIVPVSKVPFSFDEDACIDAGTSGRNSDCLVTGHRLPDEVLGIRARVSPTFGAWIFGRVLEPQIVITPLDDQIILDVVGRPAVTPQGLGIVPAAQATPEMLQRLTPPEKGTLLTSFSAGQWGSLDLWSAWNAVTKSSAAALKRLWIYRSSNMGVFGVSNCLPKGQVAGWISTNAMVYEASPPMYNPSTGALDFKIGGPALQPDGTTKVSADYELFMRSDVVKCIWPGQKVASVATVSVLDGAGGEEVTSTSVGEDGVWTKFVARNVMFPNPTASKTRASTTNPTVRVVVPKAPASGVFASCTLLRKKYKDGVSYTGAVNTVTVKGKKIVKPALGKPFVSNEIYSANMKLDTDLDGLACEREPKVR